MELIEKVGLLVLGWLLGLMTTTAQKKYRARVLKKALEKEIADAKRWLKRNQLTLEDMIKLVVVGKVATYGPVVTPMPIYKANYAEATLKLNEGERVSFSAIYTQIDMLNNKYDELTKLSIECTKDPGKMRDYAGKLELCYSNIWRTLHMIDFHLKNKKRLNHDLTTNGELGEEASIRMEEQVNQRLMDLANEARALGPSKVFEKGASSTLNEMKKQVVHLVIGEFYINTKGIKCKCLKVENQKVTWILLEGYMTVAVIVESLANAHTYTPITDPKEAARLEEIYQRFLKRNNQ